MNQENTRNKESGDSFKKGIAGEMSLNDYKRLYEQEVVKSRNLYHSLFRNQNIIMMMVDVSTMRIVDANQAAVDFYGYPYEVLTQMDVFQINPVLAKKTLRNNLEQAFRDEKNIFHGQHKLANNELRHVEVRSGKIVYEGKEMLFMTVYDITARVKAQQALEQSELKFRNAFAISPDAIVITNFETGLYVEVNEGFLNNTGYSREEVIGKTASQLNIWENIKDREKFLQVLKEKGSVKDYPISLRMKNGDIVHVLITSNYIDINGEPHLISISRNIEDILKATEAYRQSEQRYKTLFRLSPAGIVLIDETGTILEVNPVYCKNIGYTAQEIAGEKIWKVVNNPSLEKQEQILNVIQTIPEGKVVEKEVVNIKKDGTPVFLHLYETRIQLENNQSAILSISVDVTQEKRYREELARQAERLKEAQDIGRLGSWELNWQTGELYWSDGIYRLLELDFSNTPDYGLFLRYIHPEDIKTAQKVFKESIRSGKSFKYVHRLLLKDNKIKWVIERGKSFYDKNGIVVRTHGTVQDITRLKEAEDKLKELNELLEEKVRDRTAKLRKKQRDLSKLLNDMQLVQLELRQSNNALQNLNHELEAFSYSVSHDLKAPLRAIHGFTTILKEDYYSKLDKNGQVLLEDILMETRQMSEIIDALLQLSRTGRKNLNYVEFDLNPLARSVFMEQQKHYHLPNARLEMGELPLVYADYSLIKQLMANLLSNALKYSSREPNPLVEIGCNQDKTTGETVFYVRDNGVGFEEASSGKMFDAFRRLHSKKEFDGTGIGLAIARRIVARHQGKIWAKSKKGEGATFFFTLFDKNKTR